MTITVADLRTRYSADTRDLEAGNRRAQQSTERTAREMRRARDEASRGGSAFGGFGGAASAAFGPIGGMVKVGTTAILGLTAATTAATVGAVALGASFVSAANELNAGFANVASLGVANARITELKSNVQGMSILTGKTTDDLTTGLYEVVSAFGDSADAAEILETNAKAAMGGVASTLDSIKLSSAVTKGYGDTSAEAVEHVTDLALKTVELGQTTFPELAASIGKVVPLSKELGISQEELFAVMATGSGVTGNAAEVSTQYRGILQSFLAPTKTATKLFEAMGFATGEAMIQQLGFADSVGVMVQASERSGIPLQEFIGSIEGQTLALALAGAQSGKYQQNLLGMADAAGKTDAAFKAQTDGVNKIGFKLQQAANWWTVYRQKAGDAINRVAERLLPSVEPALVGLAARLEGFIPVVEAWANDVTARMMEAFNLGGGGLSGAFAALGVATGGEITVDATNKITAVKWGDFIGKLDWGNYVTSLSWGNFVISIDWNDWLSKFEWGNFAVTLDWANWGSKLEWGNYIASFDWMSMVSKIQWGDFVVRVDWANWASKLVWGDFVAQFGWEGAFSSIQWGDYIAKFDWGAGLTTIVWGDYVTAIDWGQYLPSLKWNDYISTFSWGNYIASFDWMSMVSKIQWGDFVAALDWGGMIGGIQWGDYIAVLDWGEGISTIVWGDYVFSFDWGQYIPSLSWTSIVAAFTSWSDYIGQLTWTDIVLGAIEWTTYIPVLAWNSFIAALDWVTWVATLDWGTYITGALSWGVYVTALSWSNFVTGTVSWANYIASISWSDYVTGTLAWSSYVREMAWSSFVSKLNWPSEATLFTWSSWIEKLAWPSIDWPGWADFVPSLTWPTIAWPGWSDFIPAFPGWPDLSALNFFATRATGDPSWQGGPVIVDEKGPELFRFPDGQWMLGSNQGAHLANLPAGTQIYSHEDAQRMMRGGLTPLAGMAAGNTSPPYVAYQAGSRSQAPGPSVSNEILRGLDQFVQANNRSAEKMAKATEKLGRELEGMLSKVPGLFGASPVTAQQMKLAELGVPQSFADDYLRRLTDEVVNGVNWEGVDIKDAAAKAGIDPSLPAQAILEMFTSAWNDSSLFAGGKNLDLFNQQAVQESIARQQASASGKDAIMALFGVTPAQAQGQAVALGAQLSTGITQGMTSGASGGSFSGDMISNLSAGITPEAAAPIATALASSIAAALSQSKEEGDAGIDFGSQFASAVGTSIASSKTLPDLGGAALAKMVDGWVEVKDLDFAGKLGSAIRASVGSREGSEALSAAGESAFAPFMKGWERAARGADYASSVADGVSRSAPPTNAASSTPPPPAQAASVGAASTSTVVNNYHSHTYTVNNPVDVRAVAKQVFDLGRRG